MQQTRFKPFIRHRNRKHVKRLQFYAGKQNILIFHNITSNNNTYKVKKNDGFPKQICSQCQSIITQSYSFKLQCEKSQQILLKCGAKNTFMQDRTETNEHRDQLVCVHCHKSFSSKFEHVPRQYK